MDTSPLTKFNLKYDVSSFEKKNNNTVNENSFWSAGALAQLRSVIFYSGYKSPQAPEFLSRPKTSCKDVKAQGL